MNATPMYEVIGKIASPSEEGISQREKSTVSSRSETAYMERNSTGK